MNDELSSTDLLDIDHSVKLQTFKNILFDHEISLFKEQTIDVSVDDCDILFLLIHDVQQGFGIRVLNPKTGFTETTYLHMSNPISIQTGLQHIYVLDVNNTILQIEKSNYSMKIINCNLEQLCDVVLDANERLFLLDKNDQVYLYENEKFKPFLEKNTLSKIQENGAIKCHIGRNDGNFYILGTMQSILVFSENGEYKDKITLDKSQEISNFDVFDSRNLLALFEDRIIVAKLSGTTNKEILKSFREFDHVCVSNNAIYAFDTSKNKLDVMLHADNFVHSACYVAKPFDSSSERTIWHKLVLDCKIPTNTQIDVFYYADDLSSLPEYPSWKKTPFNPSDVLIEAQGRFLWTKIVLTSLDGNSSPEINSIKAFFPRLTYLEFLPAIYSADNASKDFLAKFLSIFETVQSSIDEKINSVSRYFDPNATPDEFLEWLSMWLGHRLDQKWTNKKARILLESLPQIYKNRGTRRGLEQILSIYLGSSSKHVSFFKNEKFLIIEGFQIGCNSNSVEINALYGNNPFSFFVLLNSLEVKREFLDEIRKLVDQEKPAHTVGYVVMVEPWFELNNHTYLGVNTYLNKKILTIGESKLGRDSVVSGENI